MMSCKTAAFLRLLLWKKQPEHWCCVVGSAALSGAEGAGDADWGWRGVLCGWFQSSSDQFQLCSSVTAIYFVLLFAHIRSAAETRCSEHKGGSSLFSSLCSVLWGGGRWVTPSSCSHKNTLTRWWDSNITYDEFSIMDSDLDMHVAGVSHLRGLHGSSDRTQTDTSLFHWFLFWN